MLCEVYSMNGMPQPRLTAQEYLALERKAQFKSEYFNGEVWAMAGVSREHSLIVGNVGREIGNQFKGRRCEVHTSDLRVQVSETGLYTYPDLVAVCGEPEFEDEELDTLLNPTVVIEVLSESTEAYDRGAKFAHYRQLATLQEYVLIAQDRCLVEHYMRQEDGSWVLRAYDDPQAVLELLAIGCVLPLAEIYGRVEFPPSLERVP
jgi:Uma2 family endonuclease